VVTPPKAKTTDDLPARTAAPVKASTKAEVSRFAGRHDGTVAQRSSLLSVRCQEMTGQLVECRRSGDPTVVDWPKLTQLLSHLPPQLTVPRPTYSPHEKSLAILDETRRIAQTGEGRLGINPDLRAAYDSFQRDYDAIHTQYARIHDRTFGAEIDRPVGGVNIDHSHAGWMSAMAGLAGYRNQLRPPNLARLTQVTEPRARGGVMHHNFTRVGLGGAPSNVHIHNTKAANGEGATRIMAFVRENHDGSFSTHTPPMGAVRGAFARSSAGVELRGVNRELGAVDRKLDGYRKSLLKVKGNERATARINESVRRFTGDKQRLEADKARLEEAAAQPPVKMLDLSYDDLHVGLQQMAKQYGWSEKDTATCLLHLLGDKSRKGAALAAQLDEQVDLRGIKVKDLVDPRSDTRTADVHLSGRDLCMSLMSIMFITEPKHALPMATANRDALRAVQKGVMPMNVLFDPIELRDGPEPSFGIGQADGNLGAMLASANNLRTTLDPAKGETRRIKERAMPVTESLAAHTTSASLPHLVRDEVTPRMGVPWAESPATVDQVDARSAAVLFPFLKSLTVRTMLEREGHRT